MPVPDPITRKEQFLAAAANGSAANLPDPITCEEMYLDAIAKGGGGGGGGSSTLSGLTDVDISNPSNGQTLVYNATSGKWENGAGGGGSYTVFVGTYTENPVRITLDTTCADLYTACTNGPVGIRYTPEEGVTVTVSIASYTLVSDPDGGYGFVTADSYTAGGGPSDAPVFMLQY